MSRVLAPVSSTSPPIMQQTSTLEITCPRLKRAFVMRERPTAIGGSAAFWLGKRLFDLVLGIFLLPLLGSTVVVLALLNRKWNPGPLFFVQERMGHECRPFELIKFRTMRPTTADPRGPDEPVELERITPLGHWLRRTRLDELPQVLNVLLGEMSFIGPRPDVWEHATVYATTVPGYRARHAVRPGISGLAQVRMGYAEGTAATLHKTRKDLVYIKRVSVMLEFAILLRTLSTMSNGRGAR